MFLTLTFICDLMMNISSEHLMSLFDILFPLDGFPATAQSTWVINILRWQCRVFLAASLDVDPYCSRKNIPFQHRDHRNVAFLQDGHYSNAIRSITPLPLSPVQLQKQTIPLSSTYKTSITGFIHQYWSLQKCATDRVWLFGPWEILMNV